MREFCWVIKLWQGGNVEWQGGNRSKWTVYGVSSPRRTMRLIRSSRALGWVSFAMQRRQMPKGQTLHERVEGAVEKRWKWFEERELRRGLCGFLTRGQKINFFGHGPGEEFRHLSLLGYRLLQDVHRQILRFAEGHHQHTTDVHS